MNLGKLFVLICLLLFFLPSQVRALEIIIPDQPDYYEIKASEEVKALCGNVKSIGKVYIGRSALQTGVIPNGMIKELKDDGFIVSSDGTSVALYSKPGSGVLYGVYAFFRELGGEIFAHDCIRFPDEERLNSSLFC